MHFDAQVLSTTHHPLLQCGAVWCGVVQRVAEWSNLQRVAVWCGVCVHFDARVFFKKHHLLLQ